MPGDRGDAADQVGAGADQLDVVSGILVLRNPTIANVLDRCAISLPCHRGGDAPVGLMLVGEHGADRRLLAIAAAVEQVVSAQLDGSDGES